MMRSEKTGIVFNMRDRGNKAEVSTGLPLEASAINVVTSLKGTWKIFSMAQAGLMIFLKHFLVTGAEEAIMRQENKDISRGRIMKHKWKFPWKKLITERAGLLKYMMK